jgi:hypothetical protein
MHKSRGIALVGLGLVLLLVAGCATGPTRLETAYGMSYHFAIVSQSHHAATTRDLQVGAGLDGVAAKHTFDRYRESFEKPPPPPSFVISVGGIK